MPFDPAEFVRTVQHTVGLIPGAFLAIVFLAGPTAIWLLYRFVVQPRTSRFAEKSVDLLWICDRCRSANEVRESRCYRCGLEREAIVGDLHLVDGDGIVTLAREDEEAWDGDVLDDAGEVPVAPPVMPPLVQPFAPRAVPPAARPRRLVAVGPGRTGSRAGSAAAPTTKAPTPGSASDPGSAVTPAPSASRRRPVPAGRTPVEPPRDDTT